MEEVAIGGDAALFDKDGKLNLDVYIAYNYERLGFPSNAVLRNDLEKEVQKCLLGINVKDELDDKTLK